MRRRRPALVTLTLVAVACLLVAHVQFDLALVSIVWRTSALSWDSPSTQLLDEMASQAAPASHAATRHESRPVLHSRRALATVMDLPAGPALGGPVTRAPPAI